MSCITTADALRLRLINSPILTHPISDFIQRRNVLHAGRILSCRLSVYSACGKDNQLRASTETGLHKRKRRAAEGTAGWDMEPQSREPHMKAARSPVQSPPPGRYTGVALGVFVAVVVRRPLSFNASAVRRCAVGACQIVMNRKTVQIASRRGA